MTKISIYCNYCKNTTDECNLIIRYEEDIYLSKKHGRTAQNPIITKGEFCPHCRKMLTDNGDLVNGRIILNDSLCIKDTKMIYGKDNTNGTDRSCNMKGENKDGILYIKDVIYEY